MEPPVVVVGHGDHRCEGGKTRGRAAFTREPAGKVFVHQPGRGELLRKYAVGKRHVDPPVLHAFERRAMVVDPVDARAGGGERAQMRIGLGLAPGDVGDPELRVRAGRRRERAQHGVDLAVVREVRRHLRLPFEIARDGDGGRHAVEAVRPVTHDVDLTGHGLALWPIVSTPATQV